MRARGPSSWRESVTGLQVRLKLGECGLRLQQTPRIIQINAREYIERQLGEPSCREQRAVIMFTVELPLRMFDKQHELPGTRECKCHAASTCLPVRSIRMSRKPLPQRT